MNLFVMLFCGNGSIDFLKFSKDKLANSNFIIKNFLLFSFVVCLITPSNNKYKLK